ncbi:MAG: T9SS type A sorting domain-containing protein [Candidatus Cyclobacteriaceae bacterium M3_2C_046]
MGKKLLAILVLSYFTSFGLAQAQTGNDSEASPFVEKKITEIKTSIELYPNPSTENLFIKIEGDKLDKVKFEVYNIIGNSVKIEVEKINDNKYKIPVKNFAPGYYFLVILDKDKRYNESFKFQKK